MDTSIESTPESTKVNLSRFINKKEQVDLYRHETSFRKKTSHLIATALEKERVGKNKVEELLPQVGSYMSKAATKLSIIARASMINPFPDLTSKIAKETSQTTDRTQRKTFVISTPS